MDVLADSLRSVSITGRYTSATFEYAGLVSYSLVKRATVASGQRLTAMAKPVGWAIARPFVYIKDRTIKILPKRPRYGEDIQRITEKIQGIERRLAEIEKHGVVMTGAAGAEKKKDISKEQNFLLKAILQENKLLREAS